MDSIQKFMRGITVNQMGWGMGSIMLFVLAHFFWSLPEDLRAPRAELEPSERIEEIAKAYSRSSSLFSLMCIAGSFAAYKAMKK